MHRLRVVDELQQDQRCETTLRLEPAQILFNLSLVDPVAAARAECRRIIDEWLLLEYACCFLPCNQAAVVEAVSKGLKVSNDVLALAGIDTTLRPEQPHHIIAFTPEAEILRSVERRISGFDFEGLARRAVADGFDRAMGRV
jgi:hypothetical protein